MMIPKVNLTYGMLGYTSAASQFTLSNAETGACSSV